MTIKLTFNRNKRAYVQVTCNLFAQSRMLRNGFIVHRVLTLLAWPSEHVRYKDDLSDDLHTVEINASRVHHWRQLRYHRITMISIDCWMY